MKKLTGKKSGLVKAKKVKKEPPPPPTIRELWQDVTNCEEEIQDLKERTGLDNLTPKEVVKEARAIGKRRKRAFARFEKRFDAALAELGSVASYEKVLLEVRLYTRLLPKWENQEDEDDIAFTEREAESRLMDALMDAGLPEENDLVQLVEGGWAYAVCHTLKMLAPRPTPPGGGGGSEDDSEEQDPDGEDDPDTDEDEDEEEELPPLPPPGGREVAEADDDEEVIEEIPPGLRPR